MSKGITRERTGVLLRELFQILMESPDGVPAKEALKLLEQAVTLAFTSRPLKNGRNIAFRLASLSTRAGPSSARLPGDKEYTHMIVTLQRRERLGETSPMKHKSKPDILLHVIIAPGFLLNLGREVVEVLTPPNLSHAQVERVEGARKMLQALWEARQIDMEFMLSDEVRKGLLSAAGLSVSS